MDVDGSRLTGLACVIIPAKVNVHRCREANAGRRVIIERNRSTGLVNSQTKWLVIAALQLSSSGCDSDSVTSEHEHVGAHH